MNIQNPVKLALRIKIKDIIKTIPSDKRHLQSLNITKKIISMPIFKDAQRISIYLSTEYEVNTIDLLCEMFNQEKQVFVPTYSNNRMEMVKLNDINDYENLPVTKWNIKQPNINEQRENAMEKGLDLIILPGVGFTNSGGRLGHGKGYYDKYLHKLFNKFSSSDQKIRTKKFYSDEKLNGKQTILIGLAFREQIVDDCQLPLDSHDYPLDLVVTDD